MHSVGGIVYLRVMGILRRAGGVVSGCSVPLVPPLVVVGDSVVVGGVVIGAVVVGAVALVVVVTVVVVLVASVVTLLQPQPVIIDAISINTAIKIPAFFNFLILLFFGIRCYYLPKESCLRW